MFQRRSIPATHRLAVAISLIAGAVALAGCGDKKDDKKAATQTAARVNKEELTIHQINNVLSQQRGLRPEQADAKQERLCDERISHATMDVELGEIEVLPEPHFKDQILH